MISDASIEGVIYNAVGYLDMDNNRQTSFDESIVHIVHIDMM
jgi:hypothetical protein